MAFTEDLTVFMSLDEFAQEAVVVLPADAAGQTLAGIFDAAYLLVDVGGGIESASPVFTAADSAIPSAVADALADGSDVALDIGGTTYTVAERRPDGTGLSVLRLRKES